MVYNEEDKILKEVVESSEHPIKNTLIEPIFILLKMVLRL